MPTTKKLPKYALYDFDDGTVATGLSCLIDIASADVSDQDFDYNESHTVFWPSRPIKSSTEQDVIKLKQCAKILLFSNDISILKQYRDQLSDEIVAVELFPKIRMKVWEKSTAVEESCPGGASRQSRRLKERKQNGASEKEHADDQSKKNSSNSSLLTTHPPPKRSRKACESFNNENTLAKIVQQKSLLLNNTQRDKPGSPPPTVTVAEIHAEPISLSGNSRKRSHSVYSDKEERNDDGSTSESNSGCFTLQKLTPAKKKLVFPETTDELVDEEECEDVVPTLTRTDNLQSEVEVLSSLKASMLMGQAPVSTEDVQHLKSKIRALVEENDRLKKDLKFFQEFGSVKAWVDQLIFKQQYIQQLQKNGECASAAPLASATSSVKMNLPKLAYEDIKPHFQANGSSSPPPPVLNAPETPIEETNKQQKYPSDLYNNPFPITQDILDQIPPGSKKSETRFVGSLLRLMYTDNYLGTHTMSANLTGKKYMDENELLSIIKATLDFFQCKDHEKVKKEGEVRKGISTFLNNTKQKLKKLQNNSSKL
ncbi:uncharacterized protein LOC123476820 [Daphnia magna]|uniref:uncharacterized protein LOC123476820 n=1 Tax=Daphnia magna TaxID=35525 RepID=UPI001E1BA12B|nr:uncharacterized protein LOC123476820 [Daphnia magna]